MDDSEVIQLKNPPTARDHSSGPDDAPVTLLEYGNFECIDCKRVFPIIKNVRKVLGDNLRFVFRHFPNVKTHTHAMRAAEAAEAAGAQGKFWEMHDELFTHQTALEEHDLTRYARRIGLDVERFAHDMAESVFNAQIQADYQHSIFDEHVTGTPTIYINGIRYTGATDFESLLEAIKQGDSEHRIQLPEKGHGLHGVLDSLRRR